jgi:folate-binding protein YgfZ
MRRLKASALLLKPGADKFIQAYTTQTPGSSRGAFIDAKGKTVAVYDGVRLNADEFVVVIASAFVGRLKQHLKNYLFLTDAALIDLPHHVYWDLTGTGGPLDANPGEGADADWAIARKAGAVRILRRSEEETVGDEEFALFRVLNGLPLQGEDYDDPMLLNLNDSELVSFNKGCYLGQEIMARVHYKGRPPLRLDSLKESACPAELRQKMTSRVWDAAAGEFRGFVFLPANA